MKYVDPQGRVTVESVPTIKIIAYEGAAIPGIAQSEDMQTFREKAVAEIWTQIVVINAAGKVSKSERAGKCVTVLLTEAQQHISDMPIKVEVRSGGLVRASDKPWDESPLYYNENFFECGHRDFGIFMSEIEPQIKDDKHFEPNRIRNIQFFDIVRVSIPLIRKNWKQLLSLKINPSSECIMTNEVRLNLDGAKWYKDAVFMNRKNFDLLLVKENGQTVPLDEYKARAAPPNKITAASPVPN